MAPQARAREISVEIRRELQAMRVASTEAVRALRRRYSVVLGNEPPATVLDIAEALVATSGWAERFVACELVATRSDVVQRLTARTIERWAEGLAGWGAIDMYGVTLAGIAWREGRISDDRVMRWTRSPDRWRRRLALVATVPLNSRARGGHGDAARTLRVCRALIGDGDAMIVKAMSWALRELGKREPREVERFLNDERSRLPARVLREVRTKLETGRKIRPTKKLKRVGTPTRPSDTC